MQIRTGVVEALSDGAISPSVDTLRDRFTTSRETTSGGGDLELLATWLKTFIAEQGVQPHRDHSSRLHDMHLCEEED